MPLQRKDYRIDDAAAESYSPLGQREVTIPELKSQLFVTRVGVPVAAGTKLSSLQVSIGLRGAWNGDLPACQTESRVFTGLQADGKVGAGQAQIICRPARP